MGLTHYEILGVSPTATTNEINKAYRKISKNYHPDAAEGANNAAIFREATIARDILIDKEQRRSYDERQARGEVDDSSGAEYDSYAPNAGNSRSEQSTYSAKPKKVRSGRLLAIALGSAIVGLLLRLFGNTVGLSFLTSIGNTITSFFFYFLIAYWFVPRQKAEHAFNWAASKCAILHVTMASKRAESSSKVGTEETESTEEAAVKIFSSSSKKRLIPVVLLAALVAAGITIYAVTKLGNRAIVSTSTTTTTSIALAAIVNPSLNISPSPVYWSSNPCSVASSSCINPCFFGTPLRIAALNSMNCTTYVQRAVNNARQTLGLSDINRPSNWYDLSPEEQLFVLVNIDRLSYGYPPYVGLNANLSQQARLAAERRILDFQSVPGFRKIPMRPVGLSIADPLNAFAIDFDFMYADGAKGGPNSAANEFCKTGLESSCWYGRDMILGSDPKEPGSGVGTGCTNCEVGAARVIVKGKAVWTVVIAKPNSTTPTATFLWANEVQYFVYGPP